MVKAPTITLKKFDTGFTQVPNAVLYDKRLSLRAKGIYAYLFSKPNNWQFHIKQIQNELQETAGQIRAYIKQLIDLGYIAKKQYNEHGLFGGMIYEFTDPAKIMNRCVENTEYFEDMASKIPCSGKTAYGLGSTHNNTNLENNMEENNYNYTIMAGKDAGDKKNTYDYDKFIFEFNRFCEMAKGNTHKCLSLNPDRKEKLRKQLNLVIPIWQQKNPKKDFLAFVIEDIIVAEWNKSAFLRGEIKQSNVSFDIEWLIKERMLLKMAEGKYRQQSI